MKAEVAFLALQAAARTLKPYTTTPRWRRGAPLLHLQARGDTLTLAATTGEETAQVDMPGAIADGHCALLADVLIKTLTAMRPKGKAAAAAMVTLHAEAGRLLVRVNGGPTLGLDTFTDATDGPLYLPAMPQPRPVTAGPAGDWCQLVAAVARAASRDPRQLSLAVVRMRRDHPGVVLVVEAMDLRRAHHGRWGEPAGDPVDARMPAGAARRAATLLRACDPHGQVSVDVDDEHIRWRTDTVRLCTRLAGGDFPDLETLREQMCQDANVRFTVDRARLLAALDTAAGLAATTRHRIVRIEPVDGGDAVDVAVYADSGAPLHRIPVAVGQGSGPAHPLRLSVDYAREAIGLLAGDTVAVAAIVGHLEVHLHCDDRYAIVLQVKPEP